MDASAGKQRSALAALAEVREGMLLGVGTGSTVLAFLEALAARGPRIAAALSSSERSTHWLQAHGIAVLDPNEVGRIGLYIDGADECDPDFCLIKGGGAALTREKILAEASARFLCLIDGSKRVKRLGRFPLPIEVVPMARRLVAERIGEICGGRAHWREGVVTDNGMHLLDVHGLDIADPVALERELNQIPGVVGVGLFARRRADAVLCDGIRLERSSPQP